MVNLKGIYKASIEEIAYQNVEKLQEKRESKYALALRSWIVRWDNLKAVFLPF
jgi:hypothetical protein